MVELHFVYCHFSWPFSNQQNEQVMQNSGVSLEVIETEIKATRKVLKKYRNNGYNSAVACTRQMLLQISSWFAESRPRKNR